MTSTTILYLRHSDFEHEALRAATEEAERLWNEADSDVNDSAGIGVMEYNRRKFQARQLRGLLDRYEGSLKAVGK